MGLGPVSNDSAGFGSPMESGGTTYHPNTAAYNKVFHVLVSSSDWWSNHGDSKKAKECEVILDQMENHETITIPDGLLHPYSDDGDDT